MKDWRNLEPPNRDEFLEWMSAEMCRRQAHGEATYGNRFQGDPLVHLQEELLDGLFYCWMAMREREVLLSAYKPNSNLLPIAGMPGMFFDSDTNSIVGTPGESGNYILFRIPELLKDQHAEHAFLRIDSNDDFAAMNHK